jgi:hypothetical protein
MRINHTYWVRFYCRTTLQLDRTGVGGWNFKKIAKYIASVFSLKVGMGPLNVPPAE